MFLYGFFLIIAAWADYQLKNDPEEYFLDMCVDSSKMWDYENMMCCAKRDYLAPKFECLEYYDGYHLPEEYKAKALEVRAQKKKTEKKLNKKI